MSDGLGSQGLGRIPILSSTHPSVFAVGERGGAVTLTEILDSKTIADHVLPKGGFLSFVGAFKWSFARIFEGHVSDIQRRRA